MAMTLQKSRLRLTEAIYFGKPPGGGGGSVVSVGEGNGITTTPNPIAVGGTVALGPLTSDHDFGNFRIDSQNSTRWLNVVEFGADPTGGLDSTPGFQAAHLAIPASGGIIYAPRGQYLMQGTVTISKPGVHIQGDGRDATQIICLPVGVQTVFTLTAGASTIDNCSVRGMTLTSPDIATNKTAISVSDGKNVTIDEVNISNGWTGANSIGIKVSGRQNVHVRNVAINSADLPIVIGINPNAPQISFDFSSIESAELVVTAGSSNPSITISDGLALTNAAFLGVACVRGGAGILMNNTSLGTASHNILIENCRAEQPVVAGAYAIDFQSTSGVIQGLVVKDLNIKSGRNGIRLTNVKYASFENVLYEGTGTYLNLAANVDSPTFSNCFTAAGSSITDLSSRPVTLSHVNGANPAVSVIGALSGQALLTVNGTMEVGSNTGATGAQIDVLSSGSYNTEASDAVYVRTGVGATNVGLRIGTDKANNTAYIQSIEPGTSYTTKLLSLNPNGGRVGVNTPTPSRDLDLNGTQRYRGIAAPSVSEANSGTIYFDSATNKLKASLNGSAYVDLIGSGGLTGSGAVGRVAYWDTVTSVASPTDIYVDAGNNRIGIGVPAPGYQIDLSGDINFSGTTFLRAAGSIIFGAIGGGLTVGGTLGTLGASDLAVGSQVLANSTGGGAGGNTGVGTQAGLNVTTGANNTFVGLLAGSTTTVGSDNTILGFAADLGANNLTNAIAIGSGSVVAVSNGCVLGDGNTNVGIRTSTPKLPLDVNGAIGTRHHDVAFVNGLNSDVVPTLTSWIRATGPTAPFSIGGFTDGMDGRLMLIRNTTAFQMTLNHLDGGSAAANQISTPTAAPINCSRALLAYEDTDDLWFVISYS